ncbi:unnamed protein product [Rotaria sp. Silwood1]|nr:unnamed protein product [Rotaria sp. Silwood1]CAF1170101.1 unnamed protein product [Rotaria sp. Silwood1]CAF3484125.1 unnamed protein product [Rotaria sp. Silwood1]CAF3499648.1 unnamed protein product [Rotaria sp. Silwood1]CAF4547653.1 unnamed protein product [Rotaria sp. Silwood1]
MAAAEQTIPTTQCALQWVRVSAENPFEWTTSAPVIQPSQLGDKQVLIKNHAVALNPVDYKMAEYNFADTILPAATGYDVSGEVVAIGKGVKDFKVGDEVFGFLNLNSSNGGGALQQYSVGEADTLVKKPANVSHEDAAAIIVAFLSAMDGFRQVNIDSSTTVFIPGGSGGVGHFAVQIAQIRGAKQIITSASKDEGIKILKEQYHIKDVINHAKENVVDRVFELTQNQGVDIVYDSTYLESSFEKTIQTVKEGGSWIVLGHFGDKNSPQAKLVAKRKANLVQADIARYWLGPERAHLKTFIQDSLKQGVQWITEGKLKPYINQVIKLEEAEDAIEKIKQGQGGFGKIVVKLL